MPNRTHISIALAACAFALPAVADGNVIEMQLTPAGSFKPSDGRPMTVDAWRIDAAIATKVIDRFTRKQTPPVVDYEHQTLNKETNGKPAPAAAWIQSLQWREGQGLYATVELTQRARDHIAAREYLFVSPVFSFDPSTGEVLQILMAALTNHPAIDGMEPLALRAAATFGASHKQESAMNPLMLAICAALMLGATTTEDEAIAALSAVKPKLDELGNLRKALGVAADAPATAAVAACSALSANASDPSKFVPLAQFETLKSELAVLTARTTDREVNELVDAGLADGRLIAAQKDWAIALGRKDVAQLSAYLKTTPAIAALAGTQTQGKAPAKDDASGLTGEELAVCTSLGLTPAQFIAAK